MEICPYPMKKRLFALLLPALLAGTELFSQPFRDGEVRVRTEEEREPVIESDTTLFYRAIQSPEDLYASTDGYRLSTVSQNRRGEPFHAAQRFLHGVALDREDVSSLRMLRVSETDVGSLSPAEGVRAGDALYDLFRRSVLPATGFRCGSPIGTTVRDCVSTGLRAQDAPGTSPTPWRGAPGATCMWKGCSPTP